MLDTTDNPVFITLPSSSCFCRSMPCLVFVRRHLFRLLVCKTTFSRQDHVWRDFFFPCRTLGRFVFATLASGAAAVPAAVVLLATPFPVVAFHGLAVGFTGRFLVADFVSAALFARAGKGRVVAAIALGAFLAATLDVVTSAAARLPRRAAGFVVVGPSAISIPNTSANSASSSTLPAAGRFPALGKLAPA